MELWPVRSAKPESSHTLDFLGPSMSGIRLWIGATLAFGLVETIEKRSFSRIVANGNAVRMTIFPSKVGTGRDLGQNLGPSLVQEGVRCTPRRSARGYSGSSTEAG